MGGGLMQLVAYGAQDIYLTGNPQITFFKVVYRRHTNFSMESIQQTFNGAADFGKRVTCTVSRNGDLIHRVYLQVELPALSGLADTGGLGWCDWVGHALVKNVEVEIGGQRIDKQYGEWLHVWNELTQCSGKKAGYGTMVGESIKSDVSATTVPATTLYIPLEFWFSRNAGLALPLIALQYHEVKFNLEFNELANCVDGVTGASLSDATLYVDYIYLDTDERRRFAQVSHEYLIEQLQFTGDETLVDGSNKFKLNFNHPCKELVWVCRSDAAEAGNWWFNFTTEGTASTLDAEFAGVNPVTTAKLQLNGHDRFSERGGKYFNYVQPYQHHENVPAEGINVYSFALKPEEHQPSGSCNFSRIDNATLQLTSSMAGKAKIFATNYNVLRVMSGMGGLAYSN